LLIEIMRIAILLLGVIATITAVQTEGAAVRQKPNIVFMLIDDMGWADGACFASKFCQTPQFDALAKSGEKPATSAADQTR
jgi:hypothetical protein